MQTFLRGANVDDDDAAAADDDAAAAADDDADETDAFLFAHGCSCVPAWRNCSEECRDAGGCEYACGRGCEPSPGWR